jgi:predicted amidohydrolase
VSANDSASPVSRSIRVSAIQVEPRIGDIAFNMAACERLADEAAVRQPQWIMLPEFFTTGVAFVPELADASLPPDGKATDLLLTLARRHHAYVGGSFLCRDRDGEVRNAFFLASPAGIVARHDKDIPSCWEHCFYVGGTDDGVINVDGLSVGAVLCLEFNRTATLRRLRGKVDLVVGGNFKWGPPRDQPFYQRNLAATLAWMDWTPRFARLVGAPVVEASHCGRLEGKFPWLPMQWRTDICGSAVICDATGAVLARRDHGEGPGVIVADVEPGHIEPPQPVPSRFWIEDLDPMSKIIWHMQKWHGERWYRRHVRRVDRQASSRVADTAV